MTTAQRGDRVRITFVCTLEDGSFLDSSAGEEAGPEDIPTPVELVLGAGCEMPGLEDAIIGMAAGERKTAVVAALDAFGECYPDMATSVPRELFPAEVEPEVGMMLEAFDDEGKTFPVTIIGVEEECIRFDANHPLAGEDLHYDIELIDILGP